ncbi:hypothetical protein QQ045_030191 [Rhodiola kirilowii]
MAYVYTGDSDDDPMVMSTLATLDNPVIDEYDRDEMEELEMLVAEDPALEYTALVDSSPETFVKWDRIPLESGAMQVNRVFWAFVEPIHAFKHCRPVLSIDDIHMYEKWTNKLLVDVALDANNHLLSVCYAIVESESSSS